MSGQRVKGRAAVVTGGASGIGRASALRLAEHGAKVCLLDRSVEEAEEVRQAIERAGGEAMVVECDVSRPEQIQAGIEQAAARWGRLDIVFANAGVNGTVAPIETMETGDWDETIAINLRGTFAAVKYAIPHLKEGGGSIVITSSINGNRVFSGFGFGAYSTTKAGQVAFMKMAALELAQFKIRVNAVCPGAIETNIGRNTHPVPELEEIRIPVEFPEGGQPLEGGPGRPEQVADLVLFLASDESSHITGTAVYIDGAESLLHG
ncbi:SDR family oxidoreductase [Paenibacillus mucilaginosus]|uniref:Short-chain dehydrogenase/reductase SDR n=1 Tax=Paenibacillus mucilaginosus (strain KNP414) TaxID=1036673 RepID=F8F4N4_PAEMK|nr:SDR family NAD(P)-dependent oxidoreductase [Paenibacillus mucilaginosus]AEI39426.1 short-chain dehydrogenase/reductase SDR [Paenibacillus mucilaginosus KNP414]MCG7214737.1 SDR family oxidoreductase [Paenibacillus mucilaginosus]WDM28403.1 SDR family oxidoreductase [Paenibacillus mucilaginosus]